MQRSWLAVAAIILSFLAVACSALPGGISHPEHVEFVGEFDMLNADLYEGPDHCGCEDTWFLWIDGMGIRKAFLGDNDDLFDSAAEGRCVVYVRDPETVPEYTFEVSSSLESSLPADGTMIATSVDGYELWVDPADPQRIYVAIGDYVEAWALATEAFGCG